MKQKTPPTPTLNPAQDSSSAELEKARRIAATDGNAFHARVATYFRRRGWSVLISPYYVDNATSQAREIDLLCERVFPFEMHDEAGSGLYRIQLFVECKYVTPPIVFWFDERDHHRTREWLGEHSPFTRSRHTSLRKHRYISTGTHVAKLFRSPDSHDTIYKGLAQCLGALIQRRGGPPLEGSPDSPDEPLTDVTVQYPLIVCSDTDTPGFYRIDIDDHPSSIVPVPDIFQLEVDYAYTGQQGKITEEYFLVDVVRFRKLDTLLDLLEGEAAEAGLLLGN